MRFARWVFLTSGIYGIVALAPQYFLEHQVGTDYPPPISHPEYFYGFVGVGLAWQVLFLMIGVDPIRLRPAMLPAILEKGSFAIAVLVLFLERRVPGMVGGFACADAAWGVLFAVAFWVTPRREKPTADAGERLRKV
jgi:hypothetical protein